MSDKVLVVTGGSTGIGAAVARLAATHGYAVALSSRSSAVPAEQVVAEAAAYWPAAHLTASRPAVEQ